MDTSHDIINVSYPDFANDVKVGDDILFDDGAIDMKVQDIVGPTVYVEVQNDGVLRGSQECQCAGRAYRPPCSDGEGQAEYPLSYRGGCGLHRP